MALTVASLVAPQLGERRRAPSQRKQLPVSVLPEIEEAGGWSPVRFRAPSLYRRLRLHRRSQLPHDLRCIALCRSEGPTASGNAEAGDCGSRGFWRLQGTSAAKCSGSSTPSSETGRSGTGLGRSLDLAQPLSQLVIRPMADGGARNTPER